MPRSAELALPRLGVCSELRSVLFDLVSLTLLAKHAHWNVRGPGFVPLHALFDEVARLGGEWGDSVAERIRALDAHADGRPERVVEASDIGALPRECVADRDHVPRFHSLVESAAARVRAGLGSIGNEDPTSQDLLLGVAAGLEKQAWMLRSIRP
jgi:starvation-inducible DNA-binding protein